MTIHVMVDLETMGNKPNAAITAIGAVAYSTIKNKQIGEFYKLVCLEDSVEEGLSMDADTVLWWLSQGEAARAMYGEEKQKHKVKLKDALDELQHWYFCFEAYSEKVLTWGNGVGFDNTILRNAYDKTKMPCPFPFYNDRCYRTLKSLHPSIELKRVGVLHNALDDAKSQMSHMLEIFNRGEVE